MIKEDNKKFILKTESLVNPEDVTAISFLGDFNKWLPKKSQRKIMQKGNSTIPYMGFIVDPYCLFLAYRIKDLNSVRSMLPEGYELSEVSIFKGEDKFPMVIFCAFSARTSAFIGTRLEMYIIARNIETGLLSWIISDYETNTNSHDPKNGFGGYTSEPSVFTTSPYGELLVDFKSRTGNNEFTLTADLQRGEEKQLDEALWIEGNFSVDFGGKLKDPSSQNFGLIFDPQLMEKALKLPAGSLDIRSNSYLKDLIYWDKPESSVVFPYSQHFIIKQDLVRKELLKTDDLEILIERFLSRKGFKTMKGEDIKRPLFKGFLLSSIMNVALIIFLLVKLLF